LSGEGFLAVQPELIYPKYFGYHPQIGGISETGSDTNELCEIVALRRSRKQFEI
jgi:hypothetical protein